MVVNGSSVDKSTYPDARISPPVPPTPPGPQPEGWRNLLMAEGPVAFAKAVRAHEPPLITDTTWRDAHQSLLATRVRTVDLINIASVSAHHLSKCFSLESWGGATFDVCQRFLHESPWGRLKRLRELVPNIPFQMLLRGANAVGYTSYPDNVVYAFVKKAKEVGVDIFRVFDSLNYIPNLELGIKAIHQAGGVVEATVCYSGNILKEDCKYNVPYYLKKVEQLVELKIHILAIKDMAGLLKPRAATTLITAIRTKFPDLPIHVHTHDTAGTGVATYLAAIEAGADIVDCATDALSGLTSQPSMGAVVNALADMPIGTELKPELLAPLNDYWEETRKLYRPFESTDLRSGNSDVYRHEMPGGQYTNLQFQSQCLGLVGRWPAIKKAYAEANQLCGDIIKVTPSSKVVGDFAQFMVANELGAAQVLEKASTLDFPQSVISFFQGALGQPEGGFPEQLRRNIIRGRPEINERPGAGLAPYDFAAAEAVLRKQHPELDIREEDLVSYSLYPKVTLDFLQFRHKHGDLLWLPTHQYLRPLEVGQEISMSLGFAEEAPTSIKLLSVGALVKGDREVFWEVDGKPQRLLVPNNKPTDGEAANRPKATDEPRSIGSPMGGLVVEHRVEVGDTVKAGDAVVVISAMKMEMVISSPVDGVVSSFAAAPQSTVVGGDLLVTIDADKCCDAPRTRRHDKSEETGKTLD